MTTMAYWEKSRISIPLLVSGSVHLGLLLLLVVSPRQESIPFTEIQLMELSLPAEVEVPQAHPTPQVVSKAKSAPTVSTEPRAVPTEAIADSDVEATENGGTPEQISAQEAYKRRIAILLNARKTYPKVARQLKQQGRVVVQFLVHREGRIIEAKVVSSSPFESLNRSAEDLVKNLNGLQPFPQEIDRTSWLFSVPIDYQM